MKDEIFRTSLHTSYNLTGSPSRDGDATRTGMPSGYGHGYRR
jgi:hypothetical protein